LKLNFMSSLLLLAVHCFLITDHRSPITVH
jgi:hypothetical protein